MKLAWDPPSQKKIGIGADVLVVEDDTVRHIQYFQGCTASVLCMKCTAHTHVHHTLDQHSLFAPHPLSLPPTLTHTHTHTLSLSLSLSVFLSVSVSLSLSRVQSFSAYNHITASTY